MQLRHDVGHRVRPLTDLYRPTPDEAAPVEPARADEVIDDEEELVVQLAEALDEVADSDPCDRARLAIIAVREWDAANGRPSPPPTGDDATLPTVNQIRRWWEQSQRCLVDSTDLPAAHVQAVLDAIVALGRTGP